MSIEYRHDSTVILVDNMGGDDDVIQAASGQGIDATDKARFIDALVRDRNGIPFEHTAFKFFVETPLFVAREWMLPGIGSFSEKGGRAGRVAPRFYLPNADRPIVQAGKPDTLRALADYAIADLAETAYETYAYLLAAGVAREVARMTLPVSIFTSFYWTVNARSLMDFLSLRSTATEGYFPAAPLHEIDMAAQKAERAFAQMLPLTWAAFAENGRVAP